jgi:hypothetical protein
VQVSVVALAVQLFTGLVPPVLADHTRAVYDVKDAPPVLAGVRQLIFTVLAFGEVAVTDVGAVGTVAGVTPTLGVEAGPVPTELVATTST